MSAQPPGGVGPHAWAFRARFRRGAFGWKSQPAIQRIHEAVREITRVARHDPAQAAAGAVLFLERLSPALERVDGSSGAIGGAVNRAIRALVPIVAEAPVDAAVRRAWLDRLWEAFIADQVPYIELLADYWGELCGSKDLASEWADRLLGVTAMALRRDPGPRGYFQGTGACLSALYRAERHAEIVDLLREESFWPHRRWAVKAFAAMGRPLEAIRLAEASRGPWTSDGDVDALCEEILLSAGRAEEAYRHYGLRAERGGTHLATFRAIAKKYPHKPPKQILADLVASTPGEEGKWFTAAKGLGLYAAAAELARASPCDPRTLARAARDYATTQPAFALEAGCAALHWLSQGFGYEVTAADVWLAYTSALAAADALGRAPETRERLRALAQGHRSFVTEVLGRELGLPR